MRIPTYAANGRRLSDSSSERAERLLELKLVSARRDRRGRIRVIQFKSEPGGANPIRKSAHTGQRYSFQTWVGDARIWQHKPLVTNRFSPLLFGEPASPFGEHTEDPELLDLYVRAIYRAVPLSVQSKPEKA